MYLVLSLCSQICSFLSEVTGMGCSGVCTPAHLPWASGVRGPTTPHLMLKLGATGKTVKAKSVCFFVLQKGREEQKSWWCPLLTRHPDFWLIVNQQDTAEFQTVRLVSVLVQWPAASLNINQAPLHKTSDAVEGKHFLWDISSLNFLLNTFKCSP